jgi:hypothetical protein
MSRFPHLQASFVFLLLGASSCQKRQVSAPVTPAPVSSQPAAQTPGSATSTSGNPPAQTTTPGQEPSTTYQLNKPAVAAKKPARPTAAPTPAAASSAPVTPAVQPSTAPSDPPKLGDILSADEVKQYNASIDQSLSRAQTSLNAVVGRQLSKDQQADVEQIRSFMAQAKATRASDPSGAKSLAQRADVLARDLAARFR